MRLFVLIFGIGTIFCVGCASTARAPASSENDLYKKLAEQVLQSQIFIDSYRLTPDRADLLTKAKIKYDARAVAAKGLLAASMNLAVSNSYRAGVQYLLGKDEGQSSVGLFGLDLNNLNARASDSIASQSSGGEAPIATNQVIRLADAVQIEVRRHAIWTADFFCLKGPEVTKFVSGFENAVSGATNKKEKDVDSVDVLISLKLVSPEVVGSVRRWQASARRGDASPKLNDRATVIAELNFLSWSSSLVEAFFETEEGKRLNKITKTRLETVVTNANRVSAQAALTLN